MGVKISVARNSTESGIPDDAAGRGFSALFVFVRGGGGRSLLFLRALAHWVGLVAREWIEVWF